MPDVKSEQTNNLLPQLTMLTISRVIINTGFRMVYPLLPVLTRELNVSDATFALVLTGLQLTGLSAPLIGQVSERQGRRFTMLMGLGMYIAGMLLVFLSPTFVGFAAALLIAALGKVAFDPALQAYVGDRVPYQKRGLYLGVLEFGWAGAYIIGVPVITWLMAQSNWQMPFAVLAGLTGVSFVMAFFMLENDKPEKRKRASFLQVLRQSINSSTALAGLVLGFGISGANQLITYVFGFWIENSFGIQLSALAAASFVIGMSELGGESIVTTISDRFGKRRLVIVAIMGNILACLLLPFTAINLTVALAGLFFFYLTFETSLVATIPLASELSPLTRGMYMTVFVAAVTFGRTLATPIAPFLFEWGLMANTIVAIAFNLLALLAVWRYIRVA